MKSLKKFPRKSFLGFSLIWFPTLLENRQVPPFSLKGGAGGEPGGEPGGEGSSEQEGDVSSVRKHPFAGLPDLERSTFKVRPPIKRVGRPSGPREVHIQGLATHQEGRKAGHRKKIPTGCW